MRSCKVFLQRFAGYSLTGSLTAVLAHYAAVAPIDAFGVAQGERHPTDLAGLRGTRLVTAQETERGRYWAESKIKALTGGDPITARLVRQDFLTYIPNFKLAARCKRCDPS